MQAAHAVHAGGPVLRQHGPGGAVERPHRVHGHGGPAQRSGPQGPPASRTHWARREHGASSDWAAPLTKRCQGAEDSLRPGGPFPQRPMTARGRGLREGILRRAKRVRRVPMAAAESR